MKDPRILDTMTITEASSLLEPDRQALLQRWAETFGVALQDLHDGHIQTYQHDRSLEAPATQVDHEVEALILLLLQQGLGNSIVKYYRPLLDAFSLAGTDLDSLPLRVRLHIEHLHREIATLRATNDSQRNQIRKTNWGRPR